METATAMANIISGRADLSKRLRKYPSRTDFPAIVTEMTAILCRASSITLPLSSARTPGIRIKLVIRLKVDRLPQRNVATPPLAPLFPMRAEAFPIVLTMEGGWEAGG